MNQQSSTAMHSPLLIPFLAGLSQGLDQLAEEGSDECELSRTPVSRASWVRIMLGQSPPGVIRFALDAVSRSFGDDHLAQDGPAIRIDAYPPPLNAGVRPQDPGQRPECHVRVALAHADVAGWDAAMRLLRRAQASLKVLIAYDSGGDDGFLAWTSDALSALKSERARQPTEPTFGRDTYVFVAATCAKRGIETHAEWTVRIGCAPWFVPMDLRTGRPNATRRCTLQ